MSASSVTGTGPGSSKTRTVYTSELLPPNSLLSTSGPGADAYKATVDGLMVDSSSVSTGYLFFADQLDSPNNADWAINALAPAQQDANNNALTVRGFNDTTEQGVGFLLFIPSSCTNISFEFVGRAATAPGTAKQVAMRVYTREISDNVAVPSWSSSTEFNMLTIPTNSFFNYYNEIISLATLGLTAGNIVQFEITRNASAGSDTLNGNWNLLQLKIELMA
jgi:hypothetical protein